MICLHLKRSLEILIIINDINIYIYVAIVTVPTLLLTSTEKITKIYMDVARRLIM